MIRSYRATVRYRSSEKTVTGITVFSHRVTVTELTILVSIELQLTDCASVSHSRSQ